MSLLGEKAGLLRWLQATARYHTTYSRGDQRDRSTATKRGMLHRSDLPCCQIAVIGRQKEMFSVTPLLRS